ncbi:hypothetical protein [Janthinobacterium fluminis]|uniref:Uncharacterized protein n=1 Tax=Janthinobacterium fluminis TaxID=2987524 RepID=A0ABT5JTQ2_9BURK|nr:hypothetical protein [Janthinobacterium fluminis]MDC8756127.1 hypothetical protein [Janthinobacterium fluminis]
MRTFIVLTSLLAAGAAQADWKPRITSDTYIATVSIGGASQSYSENQNANGPLLGVAAQMLAIQPALGRNLNDVLGRKVSENGATFLGGTLSGDPTIALRPAASGITTMALSGLSYQMRNKYSGTQWGVINYSCVNTLTLNNIAITAQYGTANGAMPPENVGLTANVDSATDCDSNLSWILPVIGNLIVKDVQGEINSEIREGVKAALAQVKDQLFFQRDANWLTGLNRLIPRGTAVTLPDGSTFPIGNYVQDNLQYLLSNSQMTVRLGRGAQTRPHYGNGSPMHNSFSGDIVAIDISSPGATFSVKLHEIAQVTWKWQCSINNPNRICQEP